MHTKDFTKWHTLKSQLDELKNLPTFKEREMWWCSVGVNVGHEIDGKNRYFNRPVLVVRKFNRHIFLGVPVTTQMKNNPFYFPIDFMGKENKPRERCIMLSHLRLYDSKRLHDKMGKLSHEQFTNVQTALSKMILKKPPT